jgi:PAS domain S-box-containing protein
MQSQIQKNIKKHIDLKRSGLVFIGMVLGVIFWILESVIHVLVFQQVDFMQQLYGPEPHEVWMRLTIVGMFIAFGIYSQMIVNSRRQAEEASKLANTELTQIFETAADAMRVVDREFNVLRVNETFSTLSGMPREEIIGKKCFEVLHGPLCETPGCPLVRVLNNEHRVEIDSEKVRRDGTKIPCIITATPFRGPDGNLIGIVEDFKDISDRERSEKELMESREKLRNLAAHLQVIREEERERIAHEIHDELGQALTALKMDVHWIRHKLPEAEGSLVEKAITMSTLIDTTVQSVKRIISELRPRLLDDFGLSAAIEWQTQEFVKRTGIRCDIELEPEDIILDEARSVAIFRIFQETLTNITRHADATRARVSLKKNATAVEMRVSDNGKGISKKRLSGPQSFGLIGMRERAHSFGGNLVITGNKGEGTTVAVTIPIHRKGDNG